MIPHGWKSQVRKLPANDRADYLACIIEGVERALDENDMQRELLFRHELHLSPQPARVAILLYERRGQIVGHERLICALKCGPDCEPVNVLRVAIRHIRRAIAPFGGTIKAHNRSGYQMNCPDIPNLERKNHGTSRG